MTFLTCNNQKDAQTLLDDINAAYGCPYKAVNGYVMDAWDFVTKSDADDIWGFAKPEARLGKTSEELEAVLTSGYTEHDNKPLGWFNEEFGTDIYNLNKGI